MVIKAAVSSQRIQSTPEVCEVKSVKPQFMALRSFPSDSIFCAQL